MMKLFSLLYIFAILLLFTSGKVNSAVCQEELGKCDENCDFNCQTSKSGKGICDANGICECVLTIYNEIKLCKKGDGNGDGSSSRINKKCNVGIGPWSEHRNGCCERTCAIKYPEKQQGYGVCMNIAGIPSSRQYVCYYNF
ncbi:hypothetical protein Golob_012399 [Gossypium lobatum]|uniref:Defensin-like protein n=1 Tax=Gossypium lobatum TaxID=34289 RepID=A0A7J8LL74_9ROSI|nr:hypothetical protein [Gossypium lobatum]